MKAEDLINWAELSSALAGGRDSIRKTRIPSKHKKKISKLMSKVDEWLKEA